MSVARGGAETVVVAPLLRVTVHVPATSLPPSQCQIRVRVDDGKQCGSPAARTPWLSRMSAPARAREAPWACFMTSCQAAPSSRKTAQPTEMPHEGIANEATRAWVPRPRNGPHVTWLDGV